MKINYLTSLFIIQVRLMKMLNVGIGPETGNTRELNSGDIDLHSLVRVFPIYRWDSTYKDKLIVHR